MENLVNIELPFGYDPPAVFCPACGNPLYTPDEMKPCKHVIYAWMSESGFDYVKDDLQDYVEQLEENDAEDPLEELRKKIDQKHIVILSVNFGGMACGPVWYSAEVGIDFAPDAEESEASS